MDRLLSRGLIGRSNEMRQLSDIVDAAAAGTGGATVLTGEAGIGKSRLRHEFEQIARRRGVLVLSGRAVEAAAGPYRPLTEALQHGLRDAGFPTGRGALPLRPTLAHLVPEWSATTTGDASPLAVGEALLRLLQLLTGPQGVALVLEDLHWADPDTLAIVEYLIDHADVHRAQVLATLRAHPPSPAFHMARRLTDRRAASLIELARLPASAVDELTLSCLGQDAVSDELISFIREHSDGIPFFVEELLAGLAREGALVHRPATGWRLVEGRLTPAVPATLAASVERRLRDLGDQALHVLFAAATLGRQFDWALLAPATSMPETVIASSLREAAHAQLLVADGDQFRFPHALTRDHVIALMVPPERRQVAGRSLDAVTRAHPDLPDPWSDVAAELAEMAGRPERAAECLALTATRASARGALSTAAARLIHARDLVADRDHRLRIDEDLATVFALAGQVERAIAIGDAALRARRARGDAAAREVDLELALARAAMGSGQLLRAGLRVDGACERAAGLDDHARIARSTSLAAQIAAEQGHLQRATELAERALRAAADLPEVRCEAYETLAAVTGCTTSPAPSWRSATRWRARTATAWRSGGLARCTSLGPSICSTRCAPTGSKPHVGRLWPGAPALGAVVDFHLASAFVARGEPARAHEAIQRTIAVADRWGLSILAPAFTVLARIHAHRRRADEMEVAIARAEAAAPGDPGVQAATWGNVRAMLALHEADASGALHALDRATSIPRERLRGEHFPHWGLWALLRTLADDDGRYAREVAAGAAGRDTRLNRAHGLAADAVASGRAGRADDAADLLDRATDLIEVYEGSSWLVHAMWWLVAPAALVDGWGEPVNWLQACVRWFDAHGYVALATCSRGLLREAGASVPRRGRGTSTVPDALRGFGMTSREVDVLVLLPDDLSNREIADRLVVSPRTVEKHVANLLRKAGAADRHELARLAIEHCRDQR